MDPSLGTGRRASLSPVVVVSMDLTFSEAELENEYVREHNESQITSDLALALGIRVVGWIVSSLKAAQRGHLSTAFAMLAVGLSSGLLPVAGMLMGRQEYLRLRQWFVAASNLLQFMQVSKQYDLLYPCSGDCLETSVPLAKALTAATAANGAVFLLLTGTVGCLTFRWLFITQYTYFVILLLSNQSICAKSPALRRAFVFIWDFFREQSITSMFAAPVTHLLASGEVLGGKKMRSLRVCIVAQGITQLALGLWLSWMVAYARESANRRMFLRRRGLTGLFPSQWETIVYALAPIVYSFQLMRTLAWESRLA